MRRGSIPEAYTDVGFVHQFSIVEIGPVEFDRQCTGKCGFRIAGIGTGVIGALADGRFEGPFAAARQNPGRQGNHRYGQSGRQVIKYVVNFGGRLAELLIGWVFIPNHGIQGVGHFIGQGQGGTTEGCEKQRRGDPVNQILGYGFNSGPGKTFFFN